MEDLYLGPEIPSSKLYADITLFYLICLIYSTGMPLLYAINFVFYFVVYWTQKILILKYYRKASTFNEEITFKAILYTKYGLLMHIMIGTLMLSNSQIFGGDKVEQESWTSTIPGWITSVISVTQGRFVTDHLLFYLSVTMLIFVLYAYAATFTLWLFRQGLRLVDYLNIQRKQGYDVHGQIVNDVSNFYKDLSIDQLIQFNNRVKLEQVLFRNWKQMLNQEVNDDKAVLTNAVQKGDLMTN